MRVFALLAAGLFAGLLLTGCGPTVSGKGDSGPVTDEEAILGTWRVEKYDTGNYEQPGVLVSDIFMTFEKDGKMASVNPQGITMNSEYKIDPTAKPKAFDTAETPEKKSLGVYELEGNTLKLCVPIASVSKERPTEVKAVKGQTQLFILKRVKDK